jgi:hypothetical protein
MADNNNSNNCPKVAPQVLDGDYNDCLERSEQIAPADLVPALTSTQCTNLAENVGLDNDGHTNCEDLQGLLCDIRQDLEAVLVNNAITIFANDFSKCSETDDNPTLASMWSRIYRYAQAVTCILCTYDSFLSALLRSGTYPQVLMGAPSSDPSETPSENCCQKTGYPVWVNPDTYPTESSRRPITSDGVYKAVRDAVLSVWHLWEEHPSFTYYAENESTGDYPLDSITGMADGDTCLVKENDAHEFNVIYTYDSVDAEWKKTEVIGVGEIPNFSTTHIDSGYYSGEALYYFEETAVPNNIPTWQVLDASLTDLENRVEALEAIYAKAVQSVAQTNEEYLITTRATLADALAVPATTGKITLTFITG